MHPQGEIKVETSYGIHPILNIAGMPSWYLITIIPSFFFSRAENCLFLLPPSITFLTYLCVRWQRWFLYSAGLFPGKGIHMVVLSSVVDKGLSSILYDFLHFKEANPANASTPKLQTAKISVVHYPKVLLLKHSHVLLEVRMLLHVHDVIWLLNQISHSYSNICLLFSNTNYYAITWNHTKFL